ncbi:hypothetical protein NBRC116601_23670 [Cognatishimia sp. WU-CL00825]|uniref:hypothetical protein n=1 Tax=Cognatishimia sp. WU-CL00825 TaxID=3127658 RepID=UPI00310272A8
MRWTLGAVLSVVMSPVWAQEVVDCDWHARADAIVEPWEVNTRRFAGGDVRLALLDTIEPAAGAFHILVLSPPYDELGGRQCKTIGVSAGVGFSGAGFETLTARYDPAVGLSFAMEVTTYDPEYEFLSGTLIITLNQATGAIEAMLE